MSTLCRVLDTRTGRYYGDPNNSGDFEFTFQGNSGKIREIIGSFDRAQVMHEDRAWPMLKRDPGLSMVRVTDKIQPVSEL